MRYLLILIIANTFWAATASAQATRRHDVFGRYQQLNWDERDGLPQNTVLAIATTSDGYLWLGTYEGAARFDGVRFTLFNPSTTTGIGNSMVTSLLERHDGTLWLGTYGGGVSRFSGGQFTQYAMREGLSSDFILCLFEDQAGALWIGTDGGGVNAFSQGRFTSYTIAQGLPSNLVRAIIDDGHGGLLVGTDRGIARIADGRVTAFDARADVAQANISTLARAPDGSVWVAAMSGGLARVDARGVTAFGPDSTSTNHGGLPDARVESLYADEEGRMWVGTWRAGLFRYAADDRGGGHFEPYAQADGLPGTRVPVIARGVDHSLWVGTDGGLVRFKAPRFTVYTQRDGLASDFVGDIFQDVDGSVWVDTERGLTRFVNGTFQVLTAKEGLAGGRYRLARSNATRLPLVRSNAGLARWRHDRFVAVRDVVEIPWPRVSAVLEDRSGTLWIGIHDGGLLRVRDSQATRLTAKDGLVDDRVLSLFEDRQGRLWVGTLRNGVTLIANGQLTSWSTREGLAANHVKAFYQDAAGTIWIGTHGGGLSRFKDGRFATISARQGLYNDDIFQILEDDDANLWMSCNTGVWRTSLRQLNDVADGARAAVESFAYGTDDGMLTREAAGSFLGAAKLRDGSLWFSMAEGIVAIDPRRRDTDPQACQGTRGPRRGAQPRGARRNDDSRRRPGVRLGCGGRIGAWRRLRAEGARGTRADAGRDSHHRLGTGPWDDRDRADRCGRACRSRSMGNDIRILIADDHPIFRQGLRQVIEAQRGLTVVAEAADGHRALERLHEGNIAVAVLDVTMPGKDGFAVAREARQHRLAAALVFLTMHRDEHYLNAAIDLGVRGYVLKDNAATEIVDCVRSVADGGEYVSPTLSSFLMRRRTRAESLAEQKPALEQLTPTERRILRLVADGLTSHALTKFALQHKSDL